MSDIAERIAAARKEAETLKEKIKVKKEALADTTCKKIQHYYNQKLWGIQYPC
jgi:guanine nucleotide-binding protein G(I)/G(S)/G(T) subunit beta-1